MKEEEILALLRLQKTPMIGDIVAKKLIAHVGYANDIFKEKKQILQKINGIGKRVYGLYSIKLCVCLDCVLESLKQSVLDISFYTLG